MQDIEIEAIRRHFSFCEKRMIVFWVLKIILATLIVIMYSIKSDWLQGLIVMAVVFVMLVPTNMWSACVETQIDLNIREVENFHKSILGKVEKIEKLEREISFLSSKVHDHTHSSHNSPYGNLL
jgi:c-di-AMP phosphodiesterase-like protein